MEHEVLVLARSAYEATPVAAPEWVRLRLRLKRVPQTLHAVLLLCRSDEKYLDESGGSQDGTASLHFLAQAGNKFVVVANPLPHASVVARAMSFVQVVSSPAGGSCTRDLDTVAPRRCSTCPLSATVVRPIVLIGPLTLMLAYPSVTKLRVYTKGGAKVRRKSLFYTKDAFLWSSYDVSRACVFVQNQVLSG